MEDQKEDPTSLGPPHWGYPYPLNVELDGKLPSIKPTHVHHLNLHASHPDSSNVRMSPLQTGPFTFMHGGAVTVIQEFKVN